MAASNDDRNHGMSMPPGFEDDDSDDDELEVAPANPEPDVDPDDDIPTPRPVLKTIGASTLSYSDPDAARRNELPGQSAFDCDCRTECECDAEDRLSEFCDCEDLGCKCTEHPESGLPVSHIVTSAKTVGEAVEMTCDADLSKDDVGVERCSVYGRVVQVLWPSDESWSNDVHVRLADRSGVVDVTLDARMDHLPGDLQESDEVLITDVQRTDTEATALGVTDGESVAVRVDSSDRAVGHLLEERTELANADDVFKDCESVTAARDWAAYVIVDEWHIETPYGADTMWIYIDDEDDDNHGTFDRNGDERVREILDDHLPSSRKNQTNKNEIVALVKDRTRVEEGAFEGGSPDHEARRWSVAVQNGVIDLRTGDLHEHGPEWRCTSKLPIEYKPGEYDGIGDEWDWFISEIVEGESDREVLLIMIAHALCRCYPVEAIFALIGPGKNGKTVFTKGVKAAFGDVAGDFEFKAMAGDSEFGTGSLKDNHLVIDDDATDVKVNDLSTLKRHTGGSSGEINIKDVQRHSYDNYATVWILSNDPPVFGDLSDGATRRMVPAILPHKFTNDPSDEHKDAVPEEELIERLTSDEELEALLAVAVEYAGELYRESEIVDGRTEDERWEIYESYSDSILRFWEENTVQETGARVPRSVIYEIYVQWCNRQGIDPVSPGGRNGFWQLSDQCHAVSYKRDGVWLGDDRAVEHVMITEDALDHAPQWVRDEWKDDVAEDTSTLANRLDRVTPIEDLNGGYSTTEGTVIGRDSIESDDGSVGTEVTIEDSTRAIDVVSWDDELDGIYAGDKIQLKRVVLTQYRGVPQLKLKAATEVEVVEPGPLSKRRDNAKDFADAMVGDSGDDDDGDGDVSQRDRVETVKSKVSELESRDGDGVSVSELQGVLVGQASPEKVENEVEKLLQNGELTEPSDGRVRTT